MIATGGLLRINARRQDSLRSKPHKAHARKRKNKKKRSEVVVVKGKLKLCSVSGLIAVLGVLVLLVGVVMAALGYWPHDGLFSGAHPQEGLVMASASSSSSPNASAATQGGLMGEELEGDKGSERGGGDVGGDEGFNQTKNINATSQHQPRGFLEDFLDRYLYSDRLKVFGPLIMGIGIFLFICANAVLHENRDKKTKVINLRDIYSTVIDLHSLHKPNTSSCSTRQSSTNPLNGLVNYVQSRSLEAKPRAYPASLQNRKEVGEGGEEEGEVGGLLSRQPKDNKGGDIFSIYKEEREAPSPSPFSSHRLSLPPSFSPPNLSTCWTSMQKEDLSSFTLPLHRPQHHFSRRRHSARAGTSWGKGRVLGVEEEQWRDGKDGRQEEKLCEFSPSYLCSFTPPPHTSHKDLAAASCSSSTLHREVPGGSQALLLLSTSSLTPSHLSLSSLSHLLSPSSSTLLPPCRRRSLPTGSVLTGYSKLAQGEDDSFESTSTNQVTPLGAEEVISQRKYSNREKLRMISQVNSDLKQEEE
ncbi:transmembrane protein 200A [Parambassis ranga]|uniref:Transmembrane protein 200A n=1 Tax=Parambassis ranga TaxID=210632 RepID=A0A6P7KIK0_9TELE|nr:transmembrane protein 200A-like [Parambassis ranga]